MENTTRPGVMERGKFSLRKIIILTALTFLISHMPLLGESFPAATALITYMVSKNRIYIYLGAPAAAGIFLRIMSGYDAWSQLATVAVCCLVFAAAAGISMRLWQRAVIACSVNIIAVCVFRVAASEVYKINGYDLVLETAAVFVMVMMCDGVEKALQGKAGEKEALGAMSAAVLIAVGGAGLEFLVWPAAIVMSLAVLVYSNVGDAMFTVASCSVAAAMMGQTQWGAAVTVIIALGAASFAVKYGVMAASSIFAAVCWALGNLESGLVLGADVRWLLFSTGVFIVLNWKFKERISLWVIRFSASEREDGSSRASAAENILKSRGGDINRLAELYSTYIDGRQLLAGQFDVIGRILEDTADTVSGRSRKTGKTEKISIDISASQRAASGNINGDCCGWQDIGKGRTAIVISDGMGKGKKAACESLLVTRTILTLLRCGADAGQILKMINSIMLIKDDSDSFATVDLAILDRKTGRTKFYKIGAAPTLVKRGNSVEEVVLSAMPLGIVNGIRIKYVEASLKKGDCIVMMSDGISDGGEGGFLEKIKETVLEINSRNPETICDLIIDKATSSYTRKERDDLTVVAARLQ